VSEYKVIDFKKLTSVISESDNVQYSQSYIRGVFEGRYKSDKIKKRIEKMKKPMKVDFNLLASDVGKKIGKPYTGTYVRLALEGVYKSAGVLKVAKELLSKK
jgi:hypothetical protein